MKTNIGASLPVDLFNEFTIRSVGFPGGKSGLMKEALRAYFLANQMAPHQLEDLNKLDVDPSAVVASEPVVDTQNVV